jgi:hypothetical protein
MRLQPTHAAWFFAALAFSCAKSSRDAPPPPVTSAGDGGVRGGDVVVIESTSATFVEGKVISVVRDRAQIQLLPSGESADQSIADIYVPSSSDTPPVTPAYGRGAGDATLLRSPAPLREGSFAVCHMSDARWRGCRIEAIANQVRVVDDEATSAQLAWHDILAPTPVTELNVRQRFERNAKRKIFRDGARSAGRPRTPSNWRPAINERIIATRDGVWVGAQVKEIRKGYFRVQWDGDRRVAEAASTDVAPQPPIEFAPMAGTFVLVRPAAGGRAWSVMRVESAGTVNLILSDELGDRHEMTTRDVLPLERTGG